MRTILSLTFYTNFISFIIDTDVSNVNDCQRSVEDWTDRGLMDH